MAQKKNFSVLDLFSGIGGFSLGLEAAGAFRTVAFCEQDAFCQAVLRKHWPDVPIYDDDRTIDADRLGRVDLICGGFPCQPWSVAGEQRGAEDDRDLWPEMLRVIEAVQSWWVIGENVRGFVNEPLGLQRSLSDLESIGYQAVPFVIPACAVDAPHRRDRVWIIAAKDGTNADSKRSHRTDINEQRESKPADGEERIAGQVRAVLAGRGDAGKRQTENVADAESLRVERDRAAWQQKPQTPPDQRLPRRDSAGSGAGHWATEPDVGRVAHGISNRAHRLKALGNAVVPQVVTQIGKAIIEAEG